MKSEIFVSKQHCKLPLEVPVNVCFQEFVGSAENYYQLPGNDEGFKFLAVVSHAWEAWQLTPDL